MTITTERCLIRTFEERDLADFANYHNDLSWMQYQGFKGKTVAAYRQALLVATPDLTTGQQLAIIDRAQQKLVGDLYVKQMGTTFAIGYTIAPQFARQGYATEAVQGLLNWLRSTKDAQLLQAEVEPDNVSSRRLLMKLGFNEQGGSNDLITYTLDLT